MLRRWFAARLESLPRVDTLFKHRDIDLYLRIVAHEPHNFKIGVVVEYGYLNENNKFVVLPNRHKRVISNFQLHYRYDQYVP